ncbi:hypothetical protein BD309DRAFT_962457 [Dichomitus squalens]|nr:hypothetical protein BD309DRAFT_962457 [Dichomitus squalens]
MTLPESRIPVLSNKRKRPIDDAEYGPQKASKEGDTRELGRKALRIVTDVAALEALSPNLDELLSSTDSEGDSLFDEPSPRLDMPDIDDLRTAMTSTARGASELLPDPGLFPAKRTAPSIPGLHFDSTLLLPEDIQEDLMWTCIRTFFHEGTGNQVMLFERAPSSDPEGTSSNPSTKLPSFLADLLSTLDTLLRPRVPPEVHDVLFSPAPASHQGPPRARQAIINLYWPGEGITPHVDLPHRYGDGIMGVSLGSGCAMQFTKVPLDEPPFSPPDSPSPSPAPGQCALYLPKGSVLIMTEEARYGWTHGIEKRFDDWVEESPGSPQNVLLERDIRLSITFRWLLPGADVVGPAA